MGERTFRIDHSVIGISLEMDQLPRLRTFAVDGQQIHCYEGHGGPVRWICNCADFIEREKAFGSSFCVHIARAMMQRLLD